MNDEIVKYIKQKENFINQDFKLRFIFENVFTPENKEFYNKKLERMEEKIASLITSISPYKMKNFLKFSLVKTWKTENKDG